LQPVEESVQSDELGYSVQQTNFSKLLMSCIGRFMSAFKRGTPSVKSDSLVNTAQ